MFMFLNYLALGSKQHDFADWYGVHQSSKSNYYNVEQLSMHYARTLSSGVQGLCSAHHHPFLAYKSHCTLKLIIQESVILSHLRPGMAIMVDDSCWWRLCVRSIVTSGRPRPLHASGCMRNASYAEWKKNKFFDTEIPLSKIQIQKWKVTEYCKLLSEYM